MRLVHLDPECWLPEGFQALEILHALLDLVIKKEVVSLAVVILFLLRRFRPVRGAKRDDFLRKSGKDRRFIRLGLIFHLRLILFAGFFMVM